MILINRIIIALPLYIIYLGVGYYFLNKEFDNVLFGSIFFLFGSILMIFIISLFLSKKIMIKINNFKLGTDGMPNMTPIGRGKIYIISYTINSIIYKKTLNYSSMTKCKIGDICIAYKLDNIIILKGDLLKLLFFAIFPIITSFILLL